MTVGKKFDNGKLKWSLLPIESVEAVVEVLMFGAEKYGERNWINLENGEERFIDAALRHITTHLKGDIIDDESGLLHLQHGATSLLLALWFELNKEDGMEFIKEINKYLVCIQGGRGVQSNQTGR